MEQISYDKKKDDSWVDKLSLKEGMHQLNEREKLILNKRIFQGKTQMEVAEEIGISQAKVYSLEKAAIQQKNKEMFIYTNNTYQREKSIDSTNVIDLYIEICTDS